MNPDELKKRIKSGKVAENISLSEYTTFGTGGPAKYFVTPYDAEELSVLVRFLNDEKESFFILGNGSNLLVSDKGYDGVIVNIGRNHNQAFNSLSLSEVKDGILISAGSGVRMAAIGKAALENSLEGFEPLSGIPGSIGGAAAMNAGAYGKELKDVFYSCEGITPEGDMITLSKEEMNFGYRTSSVLDRGLIVTEVKLLLKRGDQDEILAGMEDYMKRRKEKQPLELPSAGSAFKRPEGYFAGKLIEEAGLKGYRIGGASVSAKHCGFVVNDMHGTSDDIIRLIRHIQDTVYLQSGVRLETEIKMLGDF